MTLLTDGVDLLQQAIGYALGSLTAVTPQLLPRPTPCPQWDLRTLLQHLNDSVGTLHEAIDTGRIGLPRDDAADPHNAAGHGYLDAAGPHEVAGRGYRGDPGRQGEPVPDPVATFRDRAGRLLTAWTAAGARDRMIPIAGCPLRASLVAGTGAIEITTHGWDIAQACRQRRPIPPTLAIDLLEIARPLITQTTRYPQFAAPVAVPSPVAPSDRLVAFLGRHPQGLTVRAG